ncbi:MAG: hypothetical protein AABM43_04775 [Actinomycetota bacterium]
MQIPITVFDHINKKVLVIQPGAAAGVNGERPLDELIAAQQASTAQSASK